MWKRHWKLAVLVLVLAVQAVAIGALWGQVNGLRTELADTREGAADLEERLEAADAALRELQAARASDSATWGSPIPWRGSWTPCLPMRTG